MPVTGGAASKKALQAVRSSVAKIERAVDRLAGLLRDAESAARSSNGAARRKPRLSAERRHALKLQGQYMGFMRYMPLRDVVFLLVKPFLGQKRGATKAEVLSRAVEHGRMKTAAADLTLVADEALESEVHEAKRAAR